MKVGGNAIVIDPSGVTIIGTIVKINSGGAGEETGNPSIEDPADAAASDTGEPGWLEKHKGGPGRWPQAAGSSIRSTISHRRVPASRRPMTAATQPCSIRRPTGRNAMYVYDRDNVQPVMGVAGARQVITIRQWPRRWQHGDRSILTLADAGDQASCTR